MDSKNLNVDRIKLNGDLKIVVDGNSAQFINSSFDKPNLEGQS